MPKARPLSIAEQLARCSAEFDEVIREASAGPIPPRRYDELEARTQRIAKAMIACWRGNPR